MMEYFEDHNNFKKCFQNLFEYEIDQLINWEIVNLIKPETVLSSLEDLTSTLKDHEKALRTFQKPYERGY
jgi:hypothetical protein